MLRLDQLVFDCFNQHIPDVPVPALQWPSALPTFDPVDVTDTELLQKIAGKCQLLIDNNTLLRGYDSLETTPGSRLSFVENSVSVPPHRLGQPSTDVPGPRRQFLNMRQYIVLYGLYYLSTGKHLDTATYTVLPGEILKGPGRKRCLTCCSFPVGKDFMVHFSWTYDDIVRGECGMRDVFHAPALRVLRGGKKN